MALIACPKCGQTISSLARFCPKCPPTISTEEGTSIFNVVRSVPKINPQAEESSHHVYAAKCEELLQHEFKPSLDEKIILEGRTFLVKGFFNVIEGYAYLTSKRYSLCDAKGATIIFQADRNDIVSAEEVKHLITKKIIITTGSGDEIKVKSHPHDAWLTALLAPKSVTATSTSLNPERSNEETGTLDWHYEVSGINIGPVKEDIIVQLIRNNHTIFRNTKVWNATLPEWKRADETILTIYFSEFVTSVTESMHQTKKYSYIAHMIFFPQIKLFCRKYL
jgi:hypothetical protein